ncbi:uncharacterized protein LOC115246309 isoform X1 [Formica exsecta]|uniref:uncharacterized protein LOC115246309 isoform X1 n=1 Tax=Formica exsecta TaxID=72781 RepID=UPI001141AC87|nr:uncharacterized protein LOC115246309 isoform X1 [Formica exsecta]
MYSDQREGEEGEENPLSRMSLQHHAEATAVTPDYPSVSDFERDFLGLSSHSQWSSMLHRTRHHRSRFCKILIALLQLTRCTLHRGVQRPPNCAPPSLSLERLESGKENGGWERFERFGISVTAFSYKGDYSPISQQPGWDRNRETVRSGKTCSA